MQLFTMGIDMLNQDGTLQLDSSGNPIPVYTEAQVQAFSRAYTGWTYASATGGSPTNFPNNTANYDAPMAAVASEHDTTAKTLLSGTTLPAGQTASQDLTGALTNIFNHTNVGPFVCRQLIQHLATSNPSPAYVSRIAAVFANDGSAQAVRGNLQAVVQAILLDPEARAGDANPSYDGGHLREPLLYMTNVMRGLGFTFTGAGAGTGAEYYYTPGNFTSALSEKPYTSGAVFNFFPPNYVIPGTSTNAPEFGIENTASAILRLTLADNLVYSRITDFSVDLSATSALGLTASATGNATTDRSEEHTSELQSLRHLVCRLLLEQKRMWRRRPELIGLSSWREGLVRRPEAGEGICGLFFFNDTATPEIYTLSLHDALPISQRHPPAPSQPPCPRRRVRPRHSF